MSHVVTYRKKKIAFLYLRHTPSLLSFDFSRWLAMRKPPAPDNFPTCLFLAPRFSCARFLVLHSHIFCLLFPSLCQQVLAVPNTGYFVRVFNLQGGGRLWGKRRKKSSDRSTRSVTAKLDDSKPKNAFAQSAKKIITGHVR